MLRQPPKPDVQAELELRGAGGARGSALASPSTTVYIYCRVSMVYYHLPFETKSWPSREPDTLTQPTRPAKRKPSSLPQVRRFSESLTSGMDTSRVTSSGRFRRNRKDRRMRKSFVTRTTRSTTEVSLSMPNLGSERQTRAGYRV